jgi:hypothetical protein
MRGGEQSAAKGFRSERVKRFLRDTEQLAEFLSDRFSNFTEIHMPADLRKFSENEIYISKHQAWTVLTFFWPASLFIEGDLTDQDINFAQGILLEAIDASYKMGYVHILFDTFYGKVPGSFTEIGKLTKSFAMKAVKHWFKHIGQKRLEDAEIYVAVRNVIAANFRSVIEVRRQTGELIY